MKFHFLFHVPFEGPGALESWILKHGHSQTSTALWESDSLPPLETFDFLIVMGGPMNIYEEAQYPWLKKEKDFIRKAIESGKKVLGICLGAQLIADVLGSKVYKNKQKEIGWFPVEFLPDAEKWGITPGSAEVFHWHGDTFDLPLNSVHLARSQACENQAFRYGNNVFGFQFHLEMTPQGVKNLAEHCGNEIIPGEFIQPRKIILESHAYYGSIEKTLASFLQKITLS